MRVARTQPPVGHRLPWQELALATWRAATGGTKSTDVLLRSLETRLDVRHAFAVSSGKAALVVILRALHSLTGRRKVILPAYTCYSVPSAIVLAGLEPLPCDVARGSFDYDYEQLASMLGPDVLCVLSVDLFGIPADTRRTVRLCGPHGVYVVEDAAQAMGGQSNGRWLGTRTDVGLFSLGRGKNVSTGSGGIILTRSELIGDALRPFLGRLPASGIKAEITTILSLAATSVLISPHLYWLPASLPFLKLGETVFYEDFPVRTLPAVSASLLRNWPVRLAALSAARRAVSDFYVRHIEGVRDYADGVAYLRFPMVVEKRDTMRRIMEDAKGRMLGISRMYPASVGRIPQLQGRLAQTYFPEAERLAASLLTLPTHPLLTTVDLARICEAVNGASRQRAGGQVSVLASLARIR